MVRGRIHRHDKDLALLDHTKTEMKPTKPEPISGGGIHCWSLTNGYQHLPASSEQLTTDSEHLDAGSEQTTE